MDALTPDQQRAVVEQNLSRLFAGEITSLGQLKSIADAMTDMQGIESFHTPLPWRLEIMDGESFIGESENLNNGVKDVSNQIRLLLSNLSADTDAKLLIDADRIPKSPIEASEVA